MLFAEGGFLSGRCSAHCCQSAGAPKAVLEVLFGELSASREACRPEIGDWLRLPESAILFEGPSDLLSFDYLIVQQRVADDLRWLVITVSSLVASIGIYEVTRRLQLLRESASVTACRSISIKLSRKRESFTRCSSDR